MGRLPASNFLLVSFLFWDMLRFSIRCRISVGFRLRFFKYLFYSRILVLFIFLYSKLKLLLGLG